LKVIDIHINSKDNPLHGHGVGDTILMLAVIKGVANVNPGALVRAVVLEGREQWALLGWPDVVTVDKDLKAKEPLYNELYPQRHESLGGDQKAIDRGLTRQALWAAEVGVKAVQPVPRIPAEARAWAAGMQTKLFGDKPVVWISPWACARERTWPLRRWAELADGLIAEGYAVAGIHTAKELFLDGVTWFEASAFPADRTAAMFELAKLVIGNDSGMVHLAGFLGVRTLAICGPTQGWVIFGDYPSVCVVDSWLRCAGCLGLTSDYNPRWCRLECEALHDISAGRVLLTAKRILNAAS
jgi:ADP-heptose:LPS heptosyltransferase